MNFLARARYNAGGKEKKRVYDEALRKTPEYKARRKAYMARRRVLKWGVQKCAELRVRAKKLGVPFDLTPADLVLPTVCPVLGVSLRVGGPRMGAPSVDRIVPGRGYVKGNIVVVSGRANVLKGNASVDELKKLAEFYQKLVERTDI